MIEFRENFPKPSWEPLGLAGRSDPASVAGNFLSFAPAPDAHFAGVWQHWSENVYGAHLLDAMVSVMAAARVDHTREPLSIDCTVAGLFAPDTVLRLRLAGHAMLHRMNGMRGSRSALRLRAAAERGETPGLFPIVFALQSAIYNVPARAALLAYARLEWRAAREAHGGPWDELEGTASALIIAQVDARLLPPGEADEVAAAV